MDIVTEGRERFEVMQVNQERSFLQAEVLYLQDEPGTGHRRGNCAGGETAGRNHRNWPAPTPANPSEIDSLATLFQSGRTASARSRFQADPAGDEIGSRAHASGHFLLRGHPAESAADGAGAPEGRRQRPRSLTERSPPQAQTAKDTGRSLESMPSCTLAFVVCGLRTLQTACLHEAVHQRRIIRVRSCFLWGFFIMSLPRTLGELRQSPFSEQRLSTRRVKDEMRDNLIVKLRQGGPIFPGIVGYDDTVVPQIVNAILSRHNFILLGLRGQAKSRILRALTSLLDPQVPYVAGCEIHDNPYAPICRRCREEIAKLGDNTPIAYLTPERALRGKTGHARRHHRRPDRRHRSHQGGARRTRTGQRIHRALRTAAARQSWHLRHQRTARPGGKNSGGPVQHHAGRRCAD